MASKARGRRDTNKSSLEPISIPPSELAVHHQCLSPCSSVESSIMEAIVLAGKRKINYISISSIIITFLGNPGCHTRDHCRYLSGYNSIAIGNRSYWLHVFHMEMTSEFRMTRHDGHDHCQIPRQKNIGDK